MQVSVKIPSVLRDLAKGQHLLTLELHQDADVGQMFASIAERSPGLCDRVLDEQGRLRPHVNVFVNSVSVRDAQELMTALKDGDEVWILPAVSGGSEDVSPGAGRESLWEAATEEKKQRRSRYLAATRGKPAPPIFDALEVFLPDGGRALDLGCGAGRGTLWLLDQGLSVTAVDVSDEALEIVRQALPQDAAVELVHSRFQDLDLAPQSFDVVVASYTLFFVPPGEFETLWASIIEWLRPGGVFAGEFLGVNDTWAGDGLTVHARSEVERLLEPLKTLKLDEEDKDGQTSLGEQKHWHLFHAIARKR